MRTRSIQVKETTYKLLEKLKKEMKGKSFSEVIERLIMERKGLKGDMFGIDRGRLKPYSEEDRMEDRNW